MVIFSSKVAQAQVGDSPAATRAADASPKNAALPEGGTSPSGRPEASETAQEGAPAGAIAASVADESSAASQVASFAVTQLKDSPAVVTVISGEDIRTSGARDLVDILYMVPGYFMGVDTQGVVGTGFRGLWGYEGKILVLIDGKEMNELLFSTMQFGNEFPVELIERVEVVRGPGSVIYGGSAELSVINVVTRSLQGATDLTATATYGQMTNARQLATGFGRRRVTISGRYVVDAVPGLSTFLSLSLGQGQRSVRNFVDNSGLAASLEDQSAMNPSVIQAGVGYRDIQATFLYHRLETTHISGFGQRLDAPVGTDFGGYHGELLGTFRPSSRFEIVPRFNVTYQTPWNQSDPANEFHYNKSVRRLRGRLLGRWAALDQLQVTAGGDAIFDEGRLRSPANMGFQTQFNGADSVSYQTFGGFLELFSENPIVNVAAGARYDHLSTVGGALVPRFVLLRSFGPLSLKGLFSRSFRAPAIENLNSPDGVRSERTRIYEFEAAVDVTTQHRVAANVYDVSIQSPIAYIVNTDPMTMVTTEGYINLGRQGTRGFEVSYRLRLPLIKLDANYSFYAPSAANNTPAYDVPGRSNQFLAAPAHRGSIRATVRPFEWLGITPSALILGQRYTKGPPAVADGPDTATEIPTQVLANLFLYTDKVGIPGLSVGLGIYNIFGTKYRFIHASASAGYVDDHAPLPGLDREVMLRISYLFEPS